MNLKLKLSAFFIILFVFSACNQRSSETSGVKVDENYNSKIVYSSENEIVDMIEDCEQRNGEFDDCGNGCPPDADVCMTLCVPVCNLK